MITDVVVGLQYGDEGKGKVTHHLCKKGHYSHVLRFNGGCNAGHTIIHNGKKFVTHHIPAGVFFGIKSIIGNGCVVNIAQFKKELDYLNSNGVKTKGLIFIAKNAHIITDEHLELDLKDKKIGSTKRGNGPAYSDKYARTGLRAEDVPELKEYLIDLYREFYHDHKNPKILCEGAQAFGLDIDWGDYPFVTSSHCTTASIFLNAIEPSSLRKVYGVCKAYETYVGMKRFQPTNPVFKKLQLYGNEYGSTTGRARQCNWLNLDFLKKSIKMNYVTHLVINKMDVLNDLGVWSLYEGDNTMYFPSDKEFKKHITENCYTGLTSVQFSYHPDKI